MSHFLNHSPDFLGEEPTLLNHVGGGVAVLITALIAGSFAAFQI